MRDNAEIRFPTGVATSYKLMRFGSKIKKLLIDFGSFALDCHRFAESIAPQLSSVTFLERTSISDTSAKKKMTEFIPHLDPAKLEHLEFLPPVPTLSLRGNHFGVDFILLEEILNLAKKGLKSLRRFIWKSSFPIPTELVQLVAQTTERLETFHVALGTAFFDKAQFINTIKGICIRNTSTIQHIDYGNAGNAVETWEALLAQIPAWDHYPATELSQIFKYSFGIPLSGLRIAGTSLWKILTAANAACSDALFQRYEEFYAMCYRGFDGLNDLAYLIEKRHKIEFSNEESRRAILNTIYSKTMDMELSWPNESSYKALFRCACSALHATLARVDGKSRDIKEDAEQLLDLIKFILMMNSQQLWLSELGTSDVIRRLQVEALRDKSWSIDRSSLVNTAKLLRCLFEQPLNVIIAYLTEFDTFDITGEVDARESETLFALWYDSLVRLRHVGAIKAVLVKMSPSSEYHRKWTGIFLLGLEKPSIEKIPAHTRCMITHPEILAILLALFAGNPAEGYLETTLKLALNAHGRNDAYIENNWNLLLEAINFVNSKTQALIFPRREPQWRHLREKLWAAGTCSSDTDVGLSFHISRVMRLFPDIPENYKAFASIPGSLPPFRASPSKASLRKILAPLAGSKNSKSSGSDMDI
jgi:hypothetical protein